MFSTVRSETVSVKKFLEVGINAFHSYEIEIECIAVKLLALHL